VFLELFWTFFLGHIPRGHFAAMTYNVSSGTLNPTVPYHSLLDSSPPFLHGLGHLPLSPPPSAVYC